MEEPANPYESPLPSKEKANAVTDEPDFDKRGMLSLIAGTAVLGGLDFAIANVGFAVFGPPILFFVLTFWSVMAGTRGGSLPMANRIAAATLASVLAAPCFFTLLVMTCVPATEFAGAGWDLHGGVPDKGRFVFSLVSAVMMGLVGLLMYWLMYVLPSQARRKRRKPKTISP